MIWTILFWVALAFLLAVVLWRLLASRKAGAEKGKPAPSPGLLDRLFGRGWIAPVLAVVVAVASLGMTYWPVFFGMSWNEAEQAELQHFIDAMSMYADASTLSQKERPNRQDWESINAMLQASAAEAEQVSDEVLKRIHADLPSIYRDKFIHGLNVGAYGLRYYGQPAQKGRDTVMHFRDDSLALSRQLLSEWNDWYATHKFEIKRKVEN